MWNCSSEMRWVARAVVVALFLPACSEQTRPLRPALVTDLQQHPVDPLAGPLPVVLYFVRTDCPVSNRYAPAIQKLSSRFTGRVRFYSVFVAPDETGASVQRYMKEYDLPTTPLLDPQHQLVAEIGATVTPEAAVLTGRKLVYRGRINDRYRVLGKARPRATQHDLADAIDAVLAGRPVETPRTKAVGCYISDVRPNN